MSIRRVLAIAAHSLDETLGCGGVIAWHVDTGHEVHTLILFGDGSGRDSARRENAQTAARILGSTPPRFCGFPENRSDTVPLAEVIAAIERCVFDIRPDTIYVRHGGNLNVDHQTAFKACVTAARPVPHSPVRHIYTYEVLSSTNWAPEGTGRAFQPNRFVDITLQLERKLSALEVYGDEMRPAPHARSIQTVRSLAQLRGATVGFAAGEGFEVVRELA